MSGIYFEYRCNCMEEFPITRELTLEQEIEQEFKRRKPKARSEGRTLQYPDITEITSKTFQIKYEKKLSSIAKFALNSFKNKYLYCAIDDILYLLKSNPIERNNLLAILYSPVLSLHNNLSVNFFDIWIDELYINEKSKVNKFLTKDFENFEHFSYITIKLFYKTGIPVKKAESLW
jgi:hypothetical protein